MVLSNTRMQLTSFSSWKFLFIKRSGNDIAQCLAKYPLEFDEGSVILDLSPRCSHIISEV